MIQTRIEIGKVIHKGQEHECYMPQINVGRDWKDVLPPGSYILKTSVDPVDLCKVCYGEGQMQLANGRKAGCQTCGTRGFTAGTPVDLKYIAEMLLTATINDVNKIKSFL